MVCDTVEEPCGPAEVEAVQPGRRRVVRAVGSIRSGRGPTGQDDCLGVRGLDRQVRRPHHGRVLVRVGPRHRELAMVGFVPQGPDHDRAPKVPDRTPRPVSSRRRPEEAAVRPCILREAVQFQGGAVVPARPGWAVPRNPDDRQTASPRRRVPRGRSRRSTARTPDRRTGCGSSRCPASSSSRPWRGWHRDRPPARRQRTTGCRGRPTNLPAMRHRHRPPWRRQLPSPRRGQLLQPRRSFPRP